MLDPSEREVRTGSGVGLGFQDSSSLETALLPAWPRAERQCARRARRKVAAQGGDSRPRATSRVRTAESPRLASPWAGAPRLLLRGLGSSGPPALRPPGPWQRPPHLQPEGGPVPLHQGNAEGLLEPTPSAPARPRSPPRLRARRPAARVRAAPRLRPGAQGARGGRLRQLSGSACACAGGPAGG